MQRRGFNISFVDFDVPGCPPEWLTSQNSQHCFKLFLSGSGNSSTGFTWLEAQQQCNYEQANLLTFERQEDYDFVMDSYSNSYSISPPEGPSFPWIGYTDANVEGTFETIDKGAPLWPEHFPTFVDGANRGGNDQRDCIYLDWDSRETMQAAYALDDCRHRRSFVCKRRKGHLAF